MQIWVDAKILPTETDLYSVQGYDASGVHSERYAWFISDDNKFFIPGFTIEKWSAVDFNGGVK